MATRYRDGRVLNVVARESLRRINGRLDCGTGLLNVRDHALTHASVDRGPLANDGDGAAVPTNVGNAAAHL